MNPVNCMLVLRVSAFVAVILACDGGLAAAKAQEKTNYRDIYGNLLSAVGLGSSRDPIDYTPRPPIAVPPSSDLPAPADPNRTHAAGFPNDPDRLARRKALVDPRQPVPPGESGQARAYLIEPPAAFFNPAAPDTGDRDDSPAAKPARKRRAKAIAAQ